MNITGQSWKTTSTGILMIVGAIVGLVFAYKGNSINEGTVTGAATAIVGGIGLLAAKDSNVTGGTVISASSNPEAVKASNEIPPAK